MAVTFFGTASLAHATSGTVTATWGTGQNRSVDNVLVAAVSAAASGTVSSLTATSGWTQAILSSNAGTAHSLSAFYYKIAAGSDAAPAFGATVSGTGAMTATLFELAAGNCLVPVDTSGTYASGSVAGSLASMTVATAGTVAYAGEYALTCYAQEATAGTNSWNPGAGWANAANDGTFSSVLHTAVDYQVPTAGTIASETGHWTTNATAFGAATMIAAMPWSPGLELFADNPSTTVTGATDAPAAGTAELVTASWAGFPTANPGIEPPTYFTIADQAAPSELITVINTFSGQVIRGTQNTTPVTHASGWTAFQVEGPGGLGAYPQTRNVRSVLYAGGAAGDGVTDDTLPILAALRGALPGQRVWFPAGTYRVSESLTVPPGVVLAGEAGPNPTYWGDTGSTIKPLSTFSGNQVLYFPDVSSAKTQGPYVFDLAIDGSAQSTGTTHGINAFGPVVEVYLHNVSISGMTGWGILTSQDSKASITWPYEWHVRKVFIDNCALGGISLTSMTDSTWDDVYVLGCGGNAETGSPATGPGWNILWAGNSEFTNCRSEWSGTYGWHLTGTWFTGTGAGGMSMTGCSTDRSNFDGVRIDATGNGPVLIAGHQARRDGSNGNAGGGSYAGVNIVNAAVPVVMSGLTVFPGVSDDGTGSNSPQFGLSVTGATSVTLESGYLQAATAGVNNGGGNGIFWTGPGVVTAVGTPASPSGYVSQTANSFEIFNGEVFAAEGLEVYGAVASFITGTDTSSTAVGSVPSISNNTPVQINTAQDVMLYANVKTSSTFSLAIGSGTATSTTIVNSGTNAIGLVSVRLPKAWYVKSTFTSADVAWTAVTC